MKNSFQRFLRENPDRIAEDPSPDALFSSLLRSLRSLPDASPSTPPDALAARILAAAKAAEPAARRRSAWTLVLRAAAALLLLAAASFFALRAFRAAPGADVAAANPSLQVILSAQQPDGSWSAPLQTSPELAAAQSASVSSLALLALLHSSPDPLASPEAPAIRSAVAHLAALDGTAVPDTHSGLQARYLRAMALRAAANAPSAPSDWREASARADALSPAPRTMAALNRGLARPDALPPAWIRAGGPVLVASMDLLRRRT